MSAPRLRRYWLCDAAALAALDAALDPPDWEDAGVETLIFCLDERSFARCGGLSAGDAAAVDAREAGALARLLAELLSREQAARVQICRHAVVDFGPALELLAESDALMLTGQLAETGRAGTRVETAATPEASWLAPSLVHRALAEAGLDDAKGLDRLLAAAARLVGQVEMTPLILGARFVDAGDPGEEVAWRARTAAAYARIDRLEIERRHQRLREADLSLKLERRHARELKRLGVELETMRGKLAAPWTAARWRMRAGQLKRSRMGKAIGRWF